MEKEEEKKSAAAEEPASPDPSREFNFRATVLESRRQAEAKKKQTQAQELGQESGGALQAKTDQLLKAAWENIIETFGLSFLWVDAHVVLRRIFGGKMFSKLGHEWVPANVKKAKPEMAKKIGDKAAIGEGFAVGCINFGCFVSCLGQLMVMGAIVYVVTEPLSAAKELFSVLWDLLQDWVS